MTTPASTANRDGFASTVYRDEQHNLLIRKRPNWAAVPLQSRYHLTRDLIEKLATAWENTGNTSFFSILLEPLEGVEKISLFESSQAGLYKFNKEYAHFNVAIYAEMPLFVVICTTEDFLVLAGPEGFVSSVIGPIPEAYEKFLSFLSQDGFEESVQKFFMSVLVTLRDTYPNLEPDEAAAVLKMVY